MAAGALGRGGRSARRHAKAPCGARHAGSHGGGTDLVPRARRDPLAIGHDPRPDTLYLGRCRRHGREHRGRRDGRIRDRRLSVCRAARRRPLHPGAVWSAGERSAAGASGTLWHARMSEPISPWQTSLQMLATRYAERIAVTSRTRTLTYAQLAAQAEAVRAAVVEAGVKPGEPVAILARNGPGVVV